MVEAPFAYREQAPPRAARGLLACAWHARVASRHGHHLRVLPDGCVEIVVDVGRPALVYGPRAAWFEIELSAGATPRGLRLHSGIAAALLGLDIRDLAERTVELDSLVSWSPDPGLSPRLALAGVWAGLIAERARRQIASRSPRSRASASAPAYRVATVARELGVSERHLRRRFASAVGLTWVAFRRPARVDAALRTALRRPAWSWAQVACELGYADQAHLSRDVRTVTGRSPTALL